MRNDYQMSLAIILSEIDQKIAHAQSIKIEPGNDELLHFVANVISDLYDSREEIEAQFMLDRGREVHRVH